MLVSSSTGILPWESTCMTITIVSVGSACLLDQIYASKFAHGESLASISVNRVVTYLPVCEHVDVNIMFTIYLGGIWIWCDL